MAASIQISTTEVVETVAASGVRAYTAAEGVYQPFDSSPRGVKIHVTVGYATAACGSGTNMWSRPGPIPAGQMCQHCARIGVREGRIAEIFDEV